MTEFINAPENYEEVLYWKLTHNKKAMIATNLIGIPLLIVVGALFFAWARVWHSSVSGAINILGVLGMILGFALTLALHELIHGLAMQWYGAKPSYGVLWAGLALYATAPGYAFRRNNYLIISLGPLVGLSILCALLLMLPMIGGWTITVIVLCAAINAAGAMGDIWITGIVLRYPPQAYIVDEKDGVRVLMPAKAA